MTRHAPLILLAIVSLPALVGCSSAAPPDAGPTDSGDRPAMTVYHDPQCGCCGKWAEHMRANGFEVDTVATGDMNRIKLELGVPSDLPSCHTAVVDDYVIEGHVPASEVLRLLDERPEARGLSVPGMPLGSPGMEVDHRRMAYDVILFGDEDLRAIYAHYPEIE